MIGYTFIIWAVMLVILVIAVAAALYLVAALVNEIKGMRRHSHRRIKK